MGRQTQLHTLPKDLNELLVAMHDKEPLEVALRSGNSASPEWLAFVPDDMAGQVLVLRSRRFAPNLLYCGSPTLRTSSAKRGSERMESSKKSVFKVISSRSRSRYAMLSHRKAFSLSPKSAYRLAIRYAEK